MPLSSLSMGAALGWQMFALIPGFQNRVQGPDGESYDLGNIDLTIWQNIYLTQLSLQPLAHQDVDVSSFVNFVSETITVNKVNSLFLLPTGGDVTVTPGGTNPLNWFFNGASTATTAGIKAYQDGLLMNARPGTDTVGVSVSAGAGTLRFTNGSGSATVTVTAGVIVGS